MLRKKTSEVIQQKRVFRKTFKFNGLKNTTTLKHRCKRLKGLILIVENMEKFSSSRLLTIDNLVITDGSCFDYFYRYSVFIYKFSLFAFIWKWQSDKQVNIN